eukprot:4911068-Ditylum_brightwellii.AAC.1
MRKGDMMKNDSNHDKHEDEGKKTAVKKVDYYFNPTLVLPSDDGVGSQTQTPFKGGVFLIKGTPAPSADDTILYKSWH